jgi:phosphotransferase system  glucose/maltose/N-acetylglucosamine-specific IIC component
MNSFVDTIMLIAFVLFMVFIFGGYHKNKAEQREDYKAKQKEKEENS